MNKCFFFSILLATMVACGDDDMHPNILPGEDENTDVLNYRDGISVISDDSLAFVLLAPGKSTVHLIGDFNDWTPSDTYKMKQSGDRFWIKIGGLQKGKEYVCQYLIDNSIRVADPYSAKISDPDNDKYISASVYPDLIAYPAGKTTQIASVVSTDRTAYNWQVDNFQVSKPESAVIYELHFRDFTTEGTVKAAKEKIGYLKDMGVSIVELMPINEFEGNDSWGYNPSFYFAPDKAYGTAEDYKDFIDECHVNGMGVVIDMVLNHSYGSSPLVRMYQTGVAKPSTDNPWYNASHNFATPDAQWGADFNHESKYTQALVDSICAHWMQYYKVDGFRFDFTKGFSNTYHPASGDDSWGSLYDASRVAILKRMYDQIKARKSSALVICEHLAENAEEKVLANYGFYLWGNMNYSFNEATMGWISSSDLSWTSYRNRDWSAPHLVAYMESHDEERLMYKNLQYGNATSDGTYSVKTSATALKRIEAAVVMLLSFPGPKMIWQFEELGYDVSIDFNGRTGKKPVRWDYYDNANRKAVYDVFAKMGKLRQENAAFSTSDYTVAATGAVKQILLRSASGSVCAVANFNVVAQNATLSFDKAGTWTDYFTGETVNVTGTTASVTIEAGGYRLFMSN